MSDTCYFACKGSKKNWYTQEYSQKKTKKETLPSLVSPEGLEPSTRWLRVSCSTNWARETRSANAPLVCIPREKNQLNALYFPKSGCKSTAFFWHDQIFLQKNAKRELFFYLLVQKSPKYPPKDYKDSAKRSASAIWSILPTSIILKASGMYAFKGERWEVKGERFFSQRDM